jgi:streptogramin lyase
MHTRSSYERALIAVAASLGVAALSGCGVGTLQQADASVQGAAIHGTVFGGLQPVGFATLQIYAVGTSGYGSAATPLLNKTVTTDANGNYSVSGDYTCPSSTTLVYLTATGGNPGLAAGTNNAALAEIALLGQCGSVGPSTFVTINELSTVAAVYALQPFISSMSAIGAPSTNLLGLTSGFATAMNMVSLPGGIPGNAPAIATIPSATLISLADAMSSCVNSNGSLGSSQPCGRLFTAATPTNGAEPTDTVRALIDIARNPSHNAAAIFNTIATQPPYQPGLSMAPADWTLAINYTAPAFSGPSDMAIDGQGTVWVAALPGTGGPGSTTISALTTNGLSESYVQTAKSYANMAIDISGNIWLSNTNYSNVVEMTPAGAFLGPFSGGGISGPGPMAFDPAGDLWILNSTTMISELNPSGGATFGAGWSTGGQNGPVEIAIDATGHVWTTDSAGNTVSKLTNQGALVSGAPYTNGGLSSPFAIAIDSANEAWVANRTASTLTEFAATGTPPVTTSYTGDGLLVPIAVTLDGTNTAWAVNAGSSTISALPAASAGQTSYGSAYLTNPYKIAVDGAGNVWVANVGTSVAGSGVITQIVGAAQPVVTPLSLAVKSARIAQKP